IADRWRELGAVVKPAAGTLAEEFTSPTVLSAVTRKPSPRNWRAVRELRDWVRDEHLEVVMTNTATASSLVRVAGIGVPVIYYCHGLHWNGQRLVDLLFRVIEMSLLSCTDAIACTNSSDADCFTRHAPRSPRLRLLGGVGLYMA